MCSLPRHRRTPLFASALALLVTGCGGRSPLELGDAPPPMSAAGAPSLPPVNPTAEPPAEPPPPLPPPPPPPPCEAVTLTIDELRPSVTLLVDQSGSMLSRFPSRDSEQSRWSLVRQALLDPAAGVVARLQNGIQFGLAFYTSRNGFSGGVCPMLSEVTSATGNYEAIRALYDSMAPDDDTPTGAAITKIVEQLQLRKPSKGPQVILLVTDGEADTCEVPDPQEGQAEAVAAAQRAWATGIDFYVLGISSDISGQNLQQLANAGKGRPTDAVWGLNPEAAEPFQASNSVSGLTAQLLGILERLPLCEVELDRDVSASELDAGSVVLDGVPLGYGATDGFRLKDSRHLEVVGKGCETLRSGGKSLSVSISCERGERPPR